MQDTNLSQLQATIASFRYWVPAVSDVARVEEREADGVWRITVQPFQTGACPFTLMLSRGGHYALTINGVVHAEQLVESLDLFLPLAEAIADGALVQRRWSSPNTGIETRVDTEIDIAGGRSWRGTTVLPTAAVVRDDTATISRDRRFLPYRRR